MKASHALRLSAILALILCVSSVPVLAATSQQYVLPGTPISFGDSSTTVAMTFSNRGAGTGQYSDRYDKNALATSTGAMPGLWEMRCQISLNGTHTLGAPLEYYIATSDGTLADGALATTGSTLTSDQRRVLTLVGVLSVYQTTNTTTMYASFRDIKIPTRYFHIAFWNGTAIPTETSTTKHKCLMYPMSPQMQAN